MFQQTLKTYFGYDSFRGIQEDIIRSIYAGKDTLGLMPTGGGKSVTFQVPALAMEGVCLVVTPLISLMKDQVDHLRKRGIIAYAIYSGMTHGEIVQVLDNCIYGHVKFLYLSPERLKSEFFLEKLRHIDVSFITVDEAHCISQWGYDFRPSYLNISDLRRELPDKAVLALTATATPEVVLDIQHQLAFREENVFRMSFARKNLTYVVRDTEDKEQEILHILRSVKGSAVIYTGTRKDTRELSRFLCQNGVSADFYHAGLDIAVKDKRQKDWQEDRTRVIVATNAFGMGIDKADVRLVIHYDAPQSLEAYFQEAGRAGRDGLRSYAVLLWERDDAPRMRRRASLSFPGKDYVRDIYERLSWYYEIGTGMGQGISHLFDIAMFSQTNHLMPAQVHSALKILDRIGYIRYDDEPDDAARIKFIKRHDELYYLTNITPLEDRLLERLMRTYTGLFTDYVFISEPFLADSLGVTKNDIIVLLKSLYNKGVLRYIPPRQMPKVTYLVDRVDGCDVEISEENYDLLEANVRKKSEGVITYVEDGDMCRSRQLLMYFGEETTSADDCRCCDVCTRQRRAASRDRQSEDIAEGEVHVKYGRADETWVPRRGG